MKRLLTILLIALFSLPVHAETLKIATVTPEGSQWMKDMRASAKEIEERTEGRVKVKYYGGGVMGNDQKVLSRIRLRSLQGGAIHAVSAREPVCRPESLWSADGVRLRGRGGLCT